MFTNTGASYRDDTKHINRNAQGTNPKFNKILKQQKLYSHEVEVASKHLMRHLDFSYYISGKERVELMKTKQKKEQRLEDCIDILVCSHHLVSSDAPVNSFGGLISL